MFELQADRKKRVRTARRRTFLVLLFGFVLLTWPLLRVGWGVIVAGRAVGQIDTVEVDVPGSETRLRFGRALSNPIVAEFDRSVEFLRPDGKVISNPLQIDTCGGFPINCYLLRGEKGVFVRLDDALGGHLLDVDGNKVYAIAFDGTGMYVGRMHLGSVSIGWHKVNDGPKVVTVGNAPAAPIVEVTGDHEEEYLGKLGGSLGGFAFIPAAEGPPAQLDYLRDRPEVDEAE